MAAASAYVRRPLRRGVTSLFSDMKPLYRSPAKAAQLGAIMEGILASLQSGAGSRSTALPGSEPAAASTEASAEAEPPASNTPEPTDAAGAAASPAQPLKGPGDGPQTDLWTMFYLAQHFDRLGRTGTWPHCDCPKSRCCHCGDHRVDKGQQACELLSGPAPSQV